MMDHIVFFGKVKLVTDMRFKLISGLIVDWFWLFEIVFGVGATLIENGILKENLSKIRKQEIHFSVKMKLIKSSEDHQKEIDRINGKINSNNLEIIKNLLDFPVSLCL